MSLRRLDLNLLTVFETVYEERSQQKASERLYMSQPAISNSISRLRNLLDDRLFFGSKTLQSTQKADELYVQVHKALDLIRAEIIEKEGFSPATTQRTFSMAISYTSGYILGPRLYQLFEQEAPNARLTIRTIDPHDEIPRMLRDQTIDLAVTPRTFNDAMLEYELSLNFELSVVVREGHPRIRSNPGLEALGHERFVSVHDSMYASDSPELQELIRLMDSQSVMKVPNALMLPVILSQSDLLAFIPRIHAEFMKSTYPLWLYDLPVTQTASHSRTIWHRAFNQDPGHQWFRQCCREAFATIRQEVSRDFPNALF